MSTKTESRPGEGSSKVKSNARSVQTKKDDSIMGTNDSSIVSKRSVSRLYFPQEPDFYQPFVQKYARRNPLINRGYWLRMHAIEQVVRQFLEADKDKPRVVVNLGCGYDPLPFQFWHRYPSLCQNATFVDVDYSQLIEKKVDRMLTDCLTRDSLLKTHLRPSQQPVYLRSDNYAAIGCDLRNLDTLENILKEEFQVTSVSALFVAEVSLTYMPVADSDAILRWGSTLSDDEAQFCLLEQFLPQGDRHPFARTMLQHFNKLQTPIQAVKQYPSLHDQIERFKAAKWPTLSIARNLWDLFLDDDFTPPQLRRSLDAVEPFDEWEEFALFAGHYFLILSTNYALGSTKPAIYCEATSGSVDTNPEAAVQQVVLTSHDPPAGPSPTPRRFGASFALGSDTVFVHGGQGVQRRLDSVDVLVRQSHKADIQPQPVPLARICHTITAINTTEALLVGGRTSPAQALSDCWYLQGDAWRQVEELTPARFRHSAVNVCVPSLSPSRDSEGNSVLIFGGKTGPADVLGAWSLWRPNHGWTNVPVVGPGPTARFGAALSTLPLSHHKGLVVGGMDADGTIRSDVWEWTLSVAPELQLQFVEHTNELTHGAKGTAYARLGASLLPQGDSLLLIGGVSKKEVLGLPDDFLLISCGMTIHIEKPRVNIAGDIWPLLVGFSAVSVSRDEIVVAGGGAVIFSMGSFWNHGLLSITRYMPEPVVPALWSVTVHHAEKSEQVLPIDAPRLAQSPRRLKAKAKSHGKNRRKEDVRRRPAVSRVRIHSPEDFVEILASSKPVILDGLDIGPCTSLWTLDYLKEKIGPERDTVIHECSSSRMTFTTKNFTYVKKPFGDFIDNIKNGGHTYLRAASSNQPNKLPTKLEDDFPTIASDFRIPFELSFIQTKYHSSPLRISGPVSLWLHYDVLANILCQVTGSKTLTLFPPSDVSHLSFPPGSSSSNIDASKPTHPSTHPHTADLSPGDVLFIPPMWAHSATPEQGHSVAVNVFFRNLESGYAAGRDVYGNRDLAAYENGRRDVERIVKGFKGVPRDMARFYLERLAGEIVDKAIGDGQEEQQVG
ncbi:LCM-domain-containing protein [Polyplosphaeria fusca]|uniref:tRNA wybutosine-synthesizing protein 4 n=1 Tax=Polyplosphaeria fusca TaxID=682080 RepID=A0A9P4V424_9PLEO|nr:LCM-domain-containing protein [Polyplosphaeria fusca]